MIDVKYLKDDSGEMGERGLWGVVVNMPIWNIRVNKFKF